MKYTYHSTKDDSPKSNTRVAIITIGNELLNGHTQDSNAWWLCKAMESAGYNVVKKTTVGDVMTDIVKELQHADEQANIILVTGGLGPTNDDVTKQCIAQVCNCTLTLNKEALEEITTFFQQRKKSLTATNREQAMMPQCVEKISNVIGTAPGMWLKKGNCVFVYMPGVPEEMMKMMKDVVIPRLQRTFLSIPSYQQTIYVRGIGESFLADKIADWEAALPPHIKLAYLPNREKVKLHLKGVGKTVKEAQKEVGQQIKKLRAFLGEYIDEQGHQPIAAVLGHKCRQQHKTMAIAESCTGGYAAHLLTSNPRSSDYFVGGIVAYHDKVKINQLHVPATTIAEHTSTSEAVALAMAQGVRVLFQSDIGMATTGIAGPKGDDSQQPIGNIWIACADAKQSYAQLLQLHDNRKANIQQASLACLQWAQDKLLHNN